MSKSLEQRILDAIASGEIITTDGGYPSRFYHPKIKEELLFSHNGCSIHDCPGAKLGLNDDLQRSLLPFCFSYDYMLECYCEVALVVENLEKCRVCVTCGEVQDTLTISQTFYSGFGRITDLQHRLSDVVFTQKEDSSTITVIADSLDAKFIQFMNGREEADFKPTIQEIIQRMRKK